MVHKYRRLPVQITKTHEAHASVRVNSTTNTIEDHAGKKKLYMPPPYCTENKTTATTPKIK